MKKPGIRVSQIFLEKATFSHRGDALTMPAGDRANLGRVSIGVQVGLSDDKKNGFARFEVKTEPENQAGSEGRPQYDVDIVVTGLFSQTGPDSLPIEEFLRSGAVVSVVFPFLRETLATLTMRGRFGPIYLELFNVQEIAEGLRQSIDTAKPSQRDPSNKGA
jgi:preprotein translocase subunit SecB